LDYHRSVSGLFDSVDRGGRESVDAEDRRRIDHGCPALQRAVVHQRGDHPDDCDGRIEQRQRLGHGDGQAGEYEGTWCPAGSTLRWVSSGADIPTLPQMQVMGFIRYIDSTRSV
jgi:hypothetical protein